VEPTRTVGRDGTQEWRVNGELHRVDGPAVIRANGTQVWWVHGKSITGEVEQWMISHDITYPWDEDTQIQFLLTWT